MRAGTLLALVASTSLASAQFDLSAKAPIAKKTPVGTTLHGETRVDDYRWLQDKESKETLAYLGAENAYAAAVLKRTEPLQKTLYNEMFGRIQQVDLEVPYFENGYWYYTRTVKGGQYSVYCRRKGSMKAKEQVVLDENALAKNEKFMSIGAFEVSDDGTKLAYAVDTTGFRVYTLFVKDLRTGKLLPDRLGAVASVEWAADSTTLFYTTEDKAKRPHKAWRRALGARRGTLLFEEKDALYTLWLGRTLDRRYLLLSSNSSETTESQFLDANIPRGKFTLIEPRKFDHEYYVSHRGGQFIIRTNDKGPNFRLVATPVSTPGQKHWKQVMAHNADVMLDDVELFEKFLVLTERADGFPRLRVTDLKTWVTNAVEVPEHVSTPSMGENRDFAASTFRFGYTSYTTPPSVFDYEPATGKRTLLKETPVLGGYDRSLYTTEFEVVTARDGEKIPITAVRRKDVAKGADTPLLLYGYGSYGASMNARFSSQLLSLLDRGVIFVTAHIRGGGEFGTRWHDDGKMAHKMNTFTDFIDCADHVVERGWTSREKLAIHGGSAGGLLIGAVLNLKPDVSAAAILDVPFVDVLNTMLNADLPLTVGEYLEWGNPNVRAEYDTIRQYCPYTNIRPNTSYPPMLLNTSLNDSQVMYWEPAKHIAKLRAVAKSRNVTMLVTNMAGGHGGSSGRFDALKKIARDYAFLLTVWGAERIGGLKD